MEVETFSGDNDSLSQKKPKRTVKTTAQIVGLERLYEEHKYPSETLKIQLAESLGLTEKQVSGWFCHRRSKDKRLKDDTSAHGKQDRSSGVIQDRGSGLRQDSCGSTKQGEHRLSELKEVESKRCTGEQFPGTLDITSRPGGQYISNDSGTDDTSSGNSFPLQDSRFPHSMEPRGVATSMNIKRKGHIKPVDIKGSIVRTKPSGYLKVKVRAEHVAITSVKRQLGRHYQEDGPPLGIEFDPLPPGAFESSIRDAVEEPGFVCEPTSFHSSYNPVACKQPHPGKEYEEYISRMASHNSDLDETSIQVMHKSSRQKNYLDPQFEKRPTLSYEKNPPRKMYSSMNMKEDSAREALLDIRGKKEMRAKHYGRTDEYGFSGKMKESASSHRLATYDRGLDRRQKEHTDYGDVGASITHKRSSESRPFNFPAKHNITSHSEEREAFKRATKECDTYGERRQFDGYYDPVEVSDFPANVTRPAKRPREDLPEQRYAITAGMDVATLLTNPNRRSLAEVPSSFSEDETGETSTSGDETVRD